MSTPESEAWPDVLCGTTCPHLRALRAPGRSGELAFFARQFREALRVPDRLTRHAGRLDAPLAASLAAPSAGARGHARFWSGGGGESGISLGNGGGGGDGGLLTPTQCLAVDDLHACLHCLWLGSRRPPARSLQRHMLVAEGSHFLGVKVPAAGGGGALWCGRCGDYVYDQEVEATAPLPAPANPALEVAPVRHTVRHAAAPEVSVAPVVAAVVNAKRSLSSISQLPLVPSPSLQSFGPGAGAAAPRSILEPCVWAALVAAGRVPTLAPVLGGKDARGEGGGSDGGGGALGGGAERRLALAQPGSGGGGVASGPLASLSSPAGRAAHGLRGLHNMGATCFLNCVLQVRAETAPRTRLSSFFYYKTGLRAKGGGARV